jgi:CRP-like cAMP-binding protein
MVSPELIRRYPFFAGLSMKHITALAQAAEEINIAKGSYLFHEGHELTAMYLLLEGAVGIVMELPARDTVHHVADQLTGEMETEDILVTHIGPGDVFGWSALLPPHQATAGGKALVPCRVVAFDGPKLVQTFVDDNEFGYLMLQKAANVIRQRLHDMRIESLAHMVV